MTNDSRRPDVAVFIDFENVYVSVRDKLDANPNFEMIMDRCEDFGRVVIARAYADWYRYPRVTSALYANSIEPMYVPTYYYDREMGRTGRAIKNSVDMNLCIDAMKTLFTNPNIAKFVLATGDRDFIPLVNSIRQQGKEVIIIGIGGAASAHLAQSADEFIFYESLVGKKPSDLQQDTPKAKMPTKGRENEADDEPAPERSRDRDRDRDRGRDHEREREPEREPQETARVENGDQPDIYGTLVNAINLARERGYVCSFGSLKLLMKELMGGDFKESRYKDASGRPFAKFKDFVLEAERRGKVQVFTRGTVNEVFLPNEDPYQLSQFAEEIKAEPDAPVVEDAEHEARPDTRGSNGANGSNRRRRRRRGGQRPDVLQNGAGANELLDSLEDEDADEELSELPELSLPDLSTQYQASSDEEARADLIFEELLDLVEDEQAETEELAEHAEEEAALIEEQADEAAADGEAQTEHGPETSDAPVAESEVLASTAEPVAAASLEFTADERSWLHGVVAQFGKPVSFQQIHDALRNARNTSSGSRTNEELRSLIKQSINGGELERIGKGNRITYRLAAPVSNVAEVADIAPDTTEQIAPAVDEAAETSAADAESTPADDQAVFHTPEAAAQAEQVVTAEEAAPPIEVESPAATEPAKPRRARRKKTETVEATPELAAPAAEEPPAKPSRARRKKAETVEAAPEVAAPAAEEPPAKPHRARRKKTEAAE